MGDFQSIRMAGINLISAGFVAEEHVAAHPQVLAGCLLEMRDSYFDFCRELTPELIDLFRSSCNGTIAILPTWSYPSAHETVKELFMTALCDISNAVIGPLEGGFLCDDQSHDWTHELLATEQARDGFLLTIKELNLPNSLNEARSLIDQELSRVAMKKIPVIAYSHPMKTSDVAKLFGVSERTMRTLLNDPSWPVTWRKFSDTLVQIAIADIPTKVPIHRPSAN